MTPPEPPHIQKEGHDYEDSPPTAMSKYGTHMPRTGQPQLPFFCFLAPPSICVFFLQLHMELYFEGKHRAVSPTTRVYATHLPSAQKRCDRTQEDIAAHFSSLAPIKGSQRLNVRSVEEVLLSGPLDAQLLTFSLTAVRRGPAHQRCGSCQC